MQIINVIRVIYIIYIYFFLSHLGTFLLNNHRLVGLVDACYIIITVWYVRVTRFGISELAIGTPLDEYSSLLLIIFIRLTLLDHGHNEDRPISTTI